MPASTAHLPPPSMALPPLAVWLAATAADVVDSLAAAFAADRSWLVRAAVAVHLGVRPAVVGGEDTGNATVPATGLAAVGGTGVAAVNALLCAAVPGGVSGVHSPEEEGVRRLTMTALGFFGVVARSASSGTLRRVQKREAVGHDANNKRRRAHQIAGTR